MIVSEFIEWLKTQDQAAVVQVLVADQSRYGTTTAFEEFVPEKHAYHLKIESYNDLELGQDTC